MICVFSLVLSSFFCISLYTCANVICIKLLLTYLLTYIEHIYQTHMHKHKEVVTYICYFIVCTFVRINEIVKAH